MHNTANEGSPLLGAAGAAAATTAAAAAAAAAASGPRSNGSGKAEGEPNTWNQSMRRGRCGRSPRPAHHAGGAGAAACDDRDRDRDHKSTESAWGRRLSWRGLSAGVAGVLMFSIALMGLGAIYSTIPKATENRTVQETAAAVVAAPESRDSSSSRDKVNARLGAAGGEKKNEKRMDPEANQSQSKPNVFFILIDDMGWNDIGYQSNDLQAVTPNLNKLAAGGVKMTNYYSMAICTPARASLMTGRYVVRYGMQYGLIEPGAPWSLPVTEKIFPKYMKDAGYETHMVGKWNLGSYHEDVLPHNRGFDSFMGYLTGEETYWSHQDYGLSLFGRKFFDFGFGNATGYYQIIDRPSYIVGDGSTSDFAGDDELSSTTSDLSSVSPSRDGEFKGNYSTQQFQDRTMEILREKTPFDEEPLYLYLSHQAVHPPLGLPPEGSFSPEEIAILDAIKINSVGDAEIRQRFAKVLMYLDHTVGELVDYLEKEGWMENSIIVVTSDNGACPRAGGSNYPLRGTKRTSFDGGYKMPAFVYSTSHIPQERWGTEYDGLMHVTDWLPTLASGTGIDLYGGGGPLDGIDHWDYIVNADMAAENDSPRQELLYNLDPYTLWTRDDDDIKNAKYPLAQGAFRSGKYKFISNEWCSGWYTFDKTANFADPLTNGTTVCNGSACDKCETCIGDVYTDYLFDLEADPREENNLIEIFPEIAKTLRERWVEVAFAEWVDSNFQEIDTRAFYVWATYNWWIAPWWDQVWDVTEDPFGLNSTSSSGSSSGGGGGEGVSVAIMSSQE